MKFLPRVLFALFLCPLLPLPVQAVSGTGIYKQNTHVAQVTPWQPAIESIADKATDTPSTNNTSQTALNETATDLKGAVITSTQAAVDQNKNSLSTATLTQSDIANHSTADGIGLSGGVSFSAGGSDKDPSKSGTGAKEVVGIKLSDQGNAGAKVGATSFGAASESDSSTTRSAISGATLTIGTKTTRSDKGEAATDSSGKAINTAATTGVDTAAKLAKPSTLEDIQAQVQITQSFGSQASKAVGDYADSKLKESKQLQAQANQTSDPEQKAALQKQADDLNSTWGEGGAGRVALHTVVGGLTGNTAGAVGAAAASSAAPALNDLQTKISQGLKDAGVSDSVADSAGKIISGTTAVGIGAVAGGGATGAVAAGNEDFNNRQLHPSEKQLIAQLAKDKANQSCRGDSQCEARTATHWTDLMEKAALSLVDDKAYAENLQYLTALAQTTSQPGSQGAMGGVQAYLDDYRTAQSLLTAKAGQVISVNGQTQISYGTAQTYFSATEAQRADPTVNVTFFQPLASIVSNVADRDTTRLENLSAANGSTTRIYPVEEVLVGGAVGNRVVSTVGKAVAELDVYFAGTTTATGRGTINAGNVSSEGLPVKLSVAEQTAIRAIDSQGSVQAQGTLREIVADSYFTRNGYTALDGKCGSGNCFDGVYIKGNTVYINEVKPLNVNGTIKLSGENPATGLKTQMTDEWIEGAVKRLKNGTREQQAAAEKIETALKPDSKLSLVKVVTGVDSSGMTIIKLK